MSFRGRLAKHVILVPASEQGVVDDPAQPTLPQPEKEAAISARELRQLQIGKIIQQTLELQQQGLSQAAAAKLVGVGPDTLRKWMKARGLRAGKRLRRRQWDARTATAMFNAQVSPAVIGQAYGVSASFVRKELGLDVGCPTSSDSV